MIIDPLCRQLERSVSDSTVQRQAERREEGQVEMFPLSLEEVSTIDCGFQPVLPLHTAEENKS